MSSENNLSENKLSGPTALPVGKILLGTLAIFWMKRHKLLQGLAATTLLMIAIKVIWHFIHDSFGASATMVFLVISMLLHAKFAVICHRLILIEFHADSRLVLPFSWSNRETRFFGWMFVIYFLVAVGSILATMIPFSLFAQSLPETTRNSPAQLLPYVVFFVGIPATYLLGRLSLIFPATALDRVQKLAWAWNISKHNGVRLMIVVGLIPWLSGLIGYLFAGNQPDVLTIVAINLVNYILIAMEVTALSLAYREIVRTTGSSTSTSA